MSVLQQLLEQNWRDEAFLEDRGRRLILEKSQSSHLVLFTALGGASVASVCVFFSFLLASRNLIDSANLYQKKKSIKRLFISNRLADI